jgi:hypothetical protein
MAGRCPGHRRRRFSVKKHRPRLWGWVLGLFLLAAIASLTPK